MSHDAAHQVRTYFDAAVDPDQERYLALFGPDAVVEDDGRVHDGREAVRAWRAEVPAVSYTLGDVAADGDGWVVVAVVAGDFPGSPVALRHWFRFDEEGQVAALRIRR